MWACERLLTFVPASWLWYRRVLLGLGGGLLQSTRGPQGCGVPKSGFCKGSLRILGVTEGFFLSGNCLNLTGTL